VGDDQLQDESFTKVLQAIMALIEGKYFNCKDKIVLCLSYLVNHDFVESLDHRLHVVRICMSQATKANTHHDDYKNTNIKVIGEVLQKFGKRDVPSELISELFDFFIMQLTDNLELLVK
jgi:hypothetical protein